MKKYKICLSGNPNVGKSTIFNTLTKSKQHTGNWAGKTVENAMGTYKYNNDIYEVYDLPGTYSLVTHSKEEEIARDFLCKSDVDLTIVVCNAVSLERSLNLVIQILNIAPKVMVIVNLMDEANKRNININLDKLSKLLGVPVIGSNATNKDNIKIIKKSIHKYISEDIPINPNFHKLDSTNEVLYAKKIVEKSHTINNLVTKVKDNTYIKKERKIDYLLTNKITGIPIMLILLFFIFWLTITGSNYPSELLSTYFLKLELPLYKFFSFLPTGINDVLIYGLYKTTSWVVAVMLPPMIIFFPLFTILEDIGLLPRIAFNMDPAFSKCNSCGKQALTMCMGIGCNAVGVTGCRIIDSKRERILAIITNSFMPCNGRYPTLIAVITMFFIKKTTNITSSIFCALILVSLILLSIIITLISNKLLSITILKGDNTPFILELSDYRRIKITRIIFRSILDRALYVLGRALSVAAPAGVIIYLITNVKFGDITILNILSNFLNPLGKLMALDGTILVAFLLGFPANEIVMPILLMIYLKTNTLTDYNSLSTLKTILVDNGWTTATAISFLIFTIFHFPCSTTILTIKKETNSIFYTLVAFLLPLIIGIILCMLVNFIFYLL